MITRKLIRSIIRMIRMTRTTRKISIGIEMIVKSLEEVKVIILYNYPTTLFLFP